MARFRAWVVGQLVRAADLLDMQEQTRNLAGLAAFAATGTAAFLPSADALACVPGGGMSVNVGGSSQYVFLPPPSGYGTRVAYSTGAIVQNINAADPTQQRNDLICLQFNTANAAPYLIPVKNADGSITQNVTVYQTDETFSLQYVPGTPGAGDPAVPNGWTAFARVRVVAGATTIDAAHIDSLLSTYKQLAYTPGSGIAISPGGVISNTGVTSLAGPTGPVLTGAVQVTSPDGSVSVAASGQQVQIAVAKAVPGAVYAKSVSSSAQTGTLALGGALPGTAADTYNLIVFGAVTFHDQSQTMTLTGGGAGVTWSQPSIGQGNGQGGSSALAYFGTAQGGSIPSVAWSNGNAAGYGGNIPLILTIMAFKAS